MSVTQEWYKTEFYNHESTIEHRPLETELSFYDHVAAGNLEEVEENCKKNDFVHHAGMGQLSENPIQNLKYHFAIGASIITMYCINAGLNELEAKEKCNHYILKLDNCNTIEDISSLHTKMCMELCKHMHILHKTKVFSKPVVECLDYIQEHIGERITVKTLSDQLGLSESYISKIFCKDVGISVSQYIMNMKLDKAKNLLQYSEMSVIEISKYLSFSSQSHFISVFQKNVGITPHKYRNIHFRRDWV